MLITFMARKLRGATFIEYALLAGIAMVLFFIFREQLTAIVTALLGGIRGAVDGSVTG